MNKRLAEIREHCQVVDVIQHKPYTLAGVRYFDSIYEREAWGLARCSPHDQWDSDRGKAIAVGRAEKHIAKRLPPTAGRASCLTVRDNGRHVGDVADMAPSERLRPLLVRP